MSAFKTVLVLSSLLLLSAAAPTRPAPQSPFEKEITAAHAALQSAAEKLDADALFSNVLDNDHGSIIENGRLLTTRTDALNSTRRGFRAVATLSYKFTHTHITELSPTLALWVADGASTATLTDGREISADFAETILFEKQGNTWKALHAHRSTPTPR